MSADNMQIYSCSESYKGHSNNYKMLPPVLPHLWICLFRPY